jgi:hypothetical protein
MSVRLRKWISKMTGKPGQAWVCAYNDKEGTPRLKAFKRKSDAVAFQHKVIALRDAAEPESNVIALRQPVSTIPESAMLKIEIQDGAFTVRSGLVRIFGNDGSGIYIDGEDACSYAANLFYLLDVIERTGVQRLDLPGGSSLDVEDMKQRTRELAELLNQCRARYEWPSDLQADA